MPKTGLVWGRDLANGLGLNEWKLCSELGGYDCIGEAHLVTLGGVEPTTLGIDQPLPNASVSAPIAIDRVASSACATRWARDAAGPAVLFGAVLEADTLPKRKAVAEQLVQRVLGREATADEVKNLADELYGSVSAVSKDLPRDWAVAACVVVSTSTEALFY
jgi:hypothetical protein